jgi:hypothetical protein
MKRSAVISQCGVYRYELARIWDADKPLVMVVGLNPSTADAEVDDPTIRRCVGFGRALGCGGLLMGNLYAYRATDPKTLPRDIALAVGPGNQLALSEMVLRASAVIAAWGAWPVERTLVSILEDMVIATGLTLQCLGTTKDGSPRHPLYLPAAARPIPWPKESA